MGAPPNAVCRDEVFRPSLINEPLHEAVEVWRGAKVILVPATDGTLKCYVRTLGKKKGTGAMDVSYIAYIYMIYIYIYDIYIYI